MTAPVLTNDFAATNVAFDFTRLFASLRASIVQQLFAVWFGLPDYRDANVDDWMGVALPIIKAGQETSAVATATYIDIQLGVMGMQTDNNLPDIASVTGGAIRNGVPPEVVYSRPFQEVWTALSKGHSLEESIQYGAERLRQLVETDIQLSHTHTSRSVLSKRNDIVGFRRVPTGAYTCALCLIASTQRYHKLDLMPIHPGCDCRVAPIIGEGPTGQIVDKELLEDIHKRVEDMFGFSDRSGKSLQDYRKLIVVHEHGEFGPTLAKAGNRFTII